MGQIVYIHEPYRVRVDARGYKIFHKTDEDNFHGHLKKLKTCKTLIKLIESNKVPDSPYLRECALRICRDDKYTDYIRRKIERDKERPKYVNINKGVR